MRAPDLVEGPYWQPRNIWVGVSWDRLHVLHYRRLHIYVCFVPCFPIRLTWWSVGGTP